MPTRTWRRCCLRLDRFRPAPLAVLPHPRVTVSTGMGVRGLPTTEAQGPEDQVGTAAVLIRAVTAAAVVAGLPLLLAVTQAVQVDPGMVGPPEVPATQAVAVDPTPRLQEHRIAATRQAVPGTSPGPDRTVTRLVDLATHRDSGALLPREVIQAVPRVAQSEVPAPPIPLGVPRDLSIRDLPGVLVDQAVRPVALPQVVQEVCMVVPRDQVDPRVVLLSQ